MKCVWIGRKEMEKLGGKEGGGNGEDRMSSSLRDNQDF